METFVKAREQGKVRFLGFSAHSVEAALAAMDRFEFDSVLFPLNFVTWFKGDFGPQVVEKAHSKGMGILALKAGARGKVAEGAKKPFEKCWYEPLTDPADPLLCHPRVIATPHIGFVTEDEFDLQFSEIYDQINAFAAGQPISVVA